VREHGSLVEVFVYGSGRIASWISVGAARGSGSAANSGAAMRRCLARRTAIRPISTPTGAAPSTAVMPGLGKGSGDSRVMAALDQRHAAAATRTAATGKCSQLAQARPVGGAGAAPAARSRRRRGDRDGGQQRPGAERRRCPRRSGRRRARRTSRRWPARARPRRAARWASSGHRAATRRGRRVGLGRAQGAELDCGGQHRGEDGEQRGHRQHAQLATTIAGCEGVVPGSARWPAGPAGAASATPRPVQPHAQRAPRPQQLCCTSRRAVRHVVVGPAGVRAAQRRCQLGLCTIAATSPRPVLSCSATMGRWALPPMHRSTVGWPAGISAASIACRAACTP